MYVMPSTKITTLEHGHHLECHTPQCTHTRKAAHLLTTQLIDSQSSCNARTTKFYTFLIQCPISGILWSKQEFPASIHGMLSRVSGGTISLAVHPLLWFSLLFFSGTPGLQELFWLSDKFCSETPLKVCFEENSIHFATFLGILFSESLFIPRI